ncbi:MAG: tRNA (guanosine(37)-N1)-methyltransferase TrmD, partial [Alphaproteobacteria bacterium]|nr:tRNA (guanosine(37)-N1)-methyltransferase TrmD [Alphaproteobacteria bacterium]
TRLIYFSPRGTQVTQKMVEELANEGEATFLCGRFEGIDERVLEAYGAEDVSIGDYILTGGEQAACIMLDAIVRLLPGVLGNAESAENESFESDLLEYPQYTKPAVWEGREVPEILLSGHHRKIADWRLAQSEEITKVRRPDLWKKYLDSKKN